MLFYNCDCQFVLCHVCEPSPVFLWLQSTDLHFTIHCTKSGSGSFLIMLFDYAVTLQWWWYSPVGLWVTVFPVTDKTTLYSVWSLWWLTHRPAGADVAFSHMELFVITIFQLVNTVHGNKLVFMAGNWLLFWQLQYVHNISKYIKTNINEID